MSKLNEMLRVVYSGIIPEVELNKTITEQEAIEKQVVEFMDSIWNRVCEDSMYDRVYRRFKIEFNTFYNIVTNDKYFEECEECQGHGVKEKNLIKNGIEIDVPVTCSDCCGLGRVIKE